jgi:hypothetical protein
MKTYLLNSEKEREKIEKDQDFLNSTKILFLAKKR